MPEYLLRHSRSHQFKNAWHSQGSCQTHIGTRRWLPTNVYLLYISEHLNVLCNCLSIWALRARIMFYDKSICKRCEWCKMFLTTKVMMSQRHEWPWRFCDKGDSGSKWPVPMSTVENTEKGTRVFHHDNYRSRHHLLHHKFYKTYWCLCRLRSIFTSLCKYSFLQKL